jgi:hypothetical protein
VAANPSSPLRIPGHPRDQHQATAEQHPHSGLRDGYKLKPQGKWTIGITQEVRLRAVPLNRQFSAGERIGNDREKCEYRNDQLRADASQRSIGR